MNRKSISIAILLAAIFGPLGILYSSGIGALVMLLASFVLAGGGWIGLIAAWILNIVFGAVFAQKHNNDYMVRDFT